MGVILDIANINMEELVRTVINRVSAENRAQADVLKDELIKIAQCHTDQDNDKEHTKTFNNIIADDEDIDNEAHIFNKETGFIKRDLI